MRKLSQLCCTLFLLLAAAAEAAPFVTEIAPGLFVHTGEQTDMTRENRGDIANIGFVVGDDAVAVIDAGGSNAVARDLSDAISASTDKPVRYVIITHAHPDHYFGMGVFSDAQTRIVGHHKLARGLVARGEFYRDRFRREMGADLIDELAIRAPDVEVKDTMQLDLGGRTLTLTAHATAHSSADLSVFDDKTKSLWTGDLLFINRVPSLDGSILGWTKTMQTFDQMDVDYVIPGHGPAQTDWPASVSPQLNYLNALTEDVRKIIEDNGSIQEAVENAAQSQRGKWLLFDDFHPGNVTKAFTELEWE